MFVATLDGIFKYEDLPEEYEPYVQFKATIDKRELKQSDEIAILNFARKYKYIFMGRKDNDKIIIKKPFKK